MFRNKLTQKGTLKGWKRQHIPCAPRWRVGV